MKNSLLADFEELEDSINPKREIEEFIKANYKINGELQISKEPNENGKYIVDCFDAYVKNNHITSLTNNLFEWGEIIGDFNCSWCDSLTSLEGAPKKVGGTLNCVQCGSLKTLEGAPKEVSMDFNCSWCISLTSLEGAPEEVGGNFNCISCDSLTSLKGAPKKVGRYFNCSWCSSLISFEDAPKEVSMDFKL